MDFSFFFYEIKINIYNKKQFNYNKIYYIEAKFIKYKS